MDTNLPPKPLEEVRYLAKQPVRLEKDTAGCVGNGLKYCRCLGSNGRLGLTPMVYEAEMKFSLTDTKS